MGPGLQIINQVCGVLIISKDAGPINYLLAYWTGTRPAGTQITSRHLSMNILLCAGTPNGEDNGFELNYVTAPRKFL